MGLPSGLDTDLEQRLIVELGVWVITALDAVAFRPPMPHIRPRSD
jgi:hypothetical protein